MGFSLLFDIIYVTLQSYYYQIIIVDMKKTLLTLAIMAATTTTVVDMVVPTHQATIPMQNIISRSVLNIRRRTSILTSHCA